MATKWVGATSESDRAALEIALRLDEAVTAVTVGPADAEPGLRAALAAGATSAVRIDAPDDVRSDAVATAIAPLCRRATWVLCGDASADCGSGSVPAFLAAELGAGQALGLVEVERRDGGCLRVVRRLDGGRREVLVARPPTVLSVEGSVARLRRATLPAELAAQRATIDVLAGPPGPRDRPLSVKPYRPRARELARPIGDAFARISQLTSSVGADTTAKMTRADAVILEPAAAAVTIVEALRSWGYVGEPE